MIPLAHALVAYDRSTGEIDVCDCWDAETVKKLAQRGMTLTCAAYKQWHDNLTDEDRMTWLHTEAFRLQLVCLIPEHVVLTEFRRIEGFVASTGRDWASRHLNETTLTRLYD